MHRDLGQGHCERGGSKGTESERGARHNERERIVALQAREGSGTVIVVALVALLALLGVVTVVTVVAVVAVLAMLT
jgi:hypothetical protein